jgi:tagatose-1,6-bisphosphate aldolase non-catalytic subunit AgaZ/GatZ
MMRRLFATLAVIAAFGAAPSAQSDLDSFMSQVLARRDENWKKLQQYTLAEDAIGADIALDTRIDPSFPRNAVYASFGVEQLRFAHGTRQHARRCASSRG